MLSAAASCARAAISAVGKVPSQIRDFFRGSRISDTHFPQFRIRTPRYTRCRFESRFLFVILFDSFEDGDGDGDGGGDEFEVLSVSEFCGEALIV